MTMWYWKIICTLSRIQQLKQKRDYFKSFNARKIIDCLEAPGVERLLARLSFARLAHRADREYQMWQEAVHTVLV